MGDCFVPRSDISFGLLEKTFLDSYIYPAHGLCRHKRAEARQPGGRTKCAAFAGMSSNFTEKPSNYRVSKKSVPQSELSKVTLAVPFCLDSSQISGYGMQRTIYHVTHGFLDDYLR
jgi:hypothetical protein